MCRASCLFYKPASLHLPRLFCCLPLTGQSCHMATPLSVLGGHRICHFPWESCNVTQKKTWIYYSNVESGELVAIIQAITELVMENKNWCFWTVVLEKTPEYPLGCKEIKPVNPRGNQPWIFIRRTDAEAETPILWPPDGKSWLTGKDANAGEDWGQE